MFILKTKLIENNAFHHRLLNTGQQVLSVIIWISLRLVLSSKDFESLSVCFNDLLVTTTYLAKWYLILKRFYHTKNGYSLSKRKRKTVHMNAIYL